MLLKGISFDIEGAWPDAIRGDVVRRELACYAASEADDAELHRRLGRIRAEEGRDAGEVDDAAPSALERAPGRIAAE